MSKVLRAKVSVNNENEFYENEDQEDLKDAEDGIIQNDTMGDIVSSALSDSPSFWRGIQSRIDRAERVASEAKSSSKDIQMFHSSNDVKKLNKAISGWKTSSGIVQEVVGTEFVGLSEVMQELTQLRGSFDEKIHSHLIPSMSTLLEKDIERIKNLKSNYEQHSQPYLTKMKKFLAAKANEAGIEYQNHLTDIEWELILQKKSLDGSRVDLANQVEILDEIVELKVQQLLMESFKAHMEFFTSGFNIIQRHLNRSTSLESRINDLEKQIEFQESTLASRCKVTDGMEMAHLKEELVKRASSTNTVSNSVSHGIRDLDIETEPLNQNVSKEGYLYLVKGTAQGFQHKRTWCVVDNGKLSFQRKNKFGKTLDLMICMAKEVRDMNLRNTFQIISPNTKVTLQAFNSKEMHEWIAVIQNAISFSLKRQSSSTLQSPVISKEMPNDLTMLYSIEGNGVCVDCGSKDPDWISKNLGILLCKSCSGIHRGLGTHISKVRSATLDRIDPYLLHFLKNIGNSLSNEVWLAKLEDMSPPKCHDSSREEIEKFTIRKYKDKEFIQRMDQAELQSLLFNAIDNKNYKAIISCIANDADLNRANPNQDGRTALHHAVNLMDIVIIFLLLENGASVDVVEKRGWTPLHYACYRDDPQSVELLIQRRASWLSVDKWGMDPLQLAKKSESLTAEAALQTCIEDLKLQKEKPGVSSDADVGSPPLFQRNSQNGLPSMEGALKGLTQKKHTKVGKFFKGFIKPKGSNPSI